MSYSGQSRMEVSAKYIEEALRPCTELTELDISYNQMIQNMSFLLNMPNLETLLMEYCCSIETQAAVEALRSLRRPKKVVLSMCEQFPKDHLSEIL